MSELLRRLYLWRITHLYLVRDSRYPPGGRDWKFRWPQALEFTLRITPKPVRRWLYGRWPIRGRHS